MPKRIKRLLREQAGEAYEEELRRALIPVADAFKRWERGELGSGELARIIHRFHQGPDRELSGRYNTPYLEMVVAHAIVTGLLDRQKIPAELHDHLAKALSFYERLGFRRRGDDPHCTHVMELDRAAGYTVHVGAQRRDRA